MKTWIESLKIWNQSQDKWCIPKSGTAEHDQVKAIMKGEPPVQKKKAKKDEVDQNLILAEKRVRKPKTRE